MSVHLLSHSEQLAEYLKGELCRGRWRDLMPGTLSLESELGVNRNTIHSALRLLEKQGLLAPGGSGRARRIILGEDSKGPSLRIMIQLYEDGDRSSHFMVELRHAIQEAGHTAEFAPRTLRDLGMDVRKVANFVGRTKADAWVIKSGPREILEWFSEQPIPAFAFFGRRKDLPMAGTGPDKSDACGTAVRHLAALGHRRIVMLVREDRRKPTPGELEQRFLDELEGLGIKPSAYNLPDWRNDPRDFLLCLDSLFKHTPPSALFIDEVPLFLAAQHHLAQRGIVAPRKVSLICLDSDPGFIWFQPSISHIHWSPEPMVRQVVAWCVNVSRGRIDRKERKFKAEFVVGGTIGPAV